MAGKNIVIAGATFTGVPSIEIPVSGGGSASYVEVSDTTAVAADVAQGKYFYTANGVKTAGTASGAVVQSLTVTENGTYTPPSGVDGYAPVTVNVSGGSSDPSLPAEYQEVEYVSMVAGQYVVFPTAINFQIADVFFTRAARMSGTNEQAPWGVHSDANLSSGIFQVYFASGAGTSGLALYGSNFVKAADYEVAQTGSPNSDSAYLSTAKTGYLAIGKYKGYGLNGNVYVFRVYRQDSSLKPIPFLNFVPCYRKADDVIGFYELVSGSFLTNAGTGAFGKGPDVN